MTNIDKVVELAMQLGARHLAPYGAAKSRHDFTQRQLLACLILKADLKTTYRGVLEVLATSEGLRQRLGLGNKLPHYTTLQKFSARSQVQAIAAAILAQLGGVAEAAARRWTQRAWKRRWPAHTTPAAADYDAEWLHVRAHRHGAESLIRPARSRADGTRGGYWRSRMTPEHLKARGYGQRWQVESFFSALKRKFGSTLNSRNPAQLINEATLRVLTYASHR